MPLADCKDNVTGGVLKVLLHCLTCNQSSSFLSHAFSTLRALLIKVLTSVFVGGEGGGEGGRERERQRETLV